MASEQALDLIKRLATDGGFRDQLNASDIAGKQALLAQNGFAGVTAEDVRSAAAEAFGSLSGETGVGTTVESIANAASAVSLAGVSVPSAAGAGMAGHSAAGAPAPAFAGA
ncbi:hypothetical protein JHL17_21295, partial [Azospirillum sp. YIM B02556]